MNEARPTTLSVVIPTRDTRDLTVACARSVAAIDTIKTEILVVDDGGTDDTPEALGQAVPSARVLRIEQNVGFSAAANRGVASSSGELILVLNSDTEVQHDTVPALVNAFAEDAKLGVAGASLSYPDGQPQWSGGTWPTTTWLMALTSGAPALLAHLPGYRRLRPMSGAHSKVDWVSGTAMAIRRHVWLAAGPFDEGYRFYGQDLDLCWAAHRQGFLIRVVDGFQVIHHHGATISRSTTAIGVADPALLWWDLAGFTARQNGVTAARRAVFAMRFAATIRVIARRLMTPFIGSDDRHRWRTHSAAYRHAIQVLSGEEMTPWLKDRSRPSRPQ